MPRFPGHLLVLSTLCALAPNAMAGNALVSAGECPEAAAVEGRVRGLGAISSLEDLGSAEIAVEGLSLKVHFRDRRGDLLGTRIIAVSDDCDARARLAAAVIASFVGNLGQPRMAATPAPPAAKPHPTPASSEPWQAELAAFGFGVHDGDRGGLGFGTRAHATRGAWGAAALAEATLQRDRALGRGRGAYRYVRLGLGPTLRGQWGSLFGDATLMPMAERLTMQGKDLLISRTVDTWGLAAALSARLGWSGRRLRPFLFVAASYSLPPQRMNLAQSDIAVPLSPVNVEFGVGLSWRFGP